MFENNPPLESQTAAVGCQKDEMRSYLCSVRFKGAAPASSSPHLIISEQNCLLAVSNAPRFRRKAKLPIPMQKKKKNNSNKERQRPLPVCPPRFRRLAEQFTAICCSNVDLGDARMNPKCKY